MTSVGADDASLGVGAGTASVDNGEKPIENWICDTLERGKHDAGALAELPLRPENVSVAGLGSLIAGRGFTVVQDNSSWNTHRGLMMDIICGMTPDVVLRSADSGENRIIIEVKRHTSLGHDENACQLTRYFLHLLATSTQSKGEDIQRAVILAAPKAWFDVPANAQDWDRFVTRFGPLAAHFGVVLAKLYTPPQFD